MIPSTSARSCWATPPEGCDVVFSQMFLGNCKASDERKGGASVSPPNDTARYENCTALTSCGRLQGALQSRDHAVPRLMPWK